MICGWLLKSALLSKATHIKNIRVIPFTTTSRRVQFLAREYGHQGHNLKNISIFSSHLGRPIFEYAYGCLFNL